VVVYNRKGMIFKTLLDDMSDGRKKTNCSTLYRVVLKNLVNFHVDMRYLLVLLLLCSVTLYAQPLRDINYIYQYSPDQIFTFNLKPVRTAEGYLALYNLQLRDTSNNIGDFWIRWEIRSSLSEKEGKVIQMDSVLKNMGQKQLTGRVLLIAPSETQILVAKVLNNSLKRAWLFYSFIQPNYPVNGYLEVNGAPALKPFINKNLSSTIKAADANKVISYYNDNFPAASPAFSESLGKVSKGMQVDSTYTINISGAKNFTDKGLYLVQNDTNSAEGFSFRVEDDYPRLARIESLADPLIYVCTKQEFDRVKSAKGDKKAFDKVILNVTGDAERAKKFMRSYFKRVELANQYFTSYKEGWKTDRGMIYIIFGLPDEVFKFSDREVWNYNNTSFKISFDFVKSSTVFDPENYVLVREKKYQQTWYEVIDLWRNARF
jgi:GWxTD domain-containing protein